jgi:hypothetical protein
MNPTDNNDAKSIRASPEDSVLNEASRTIFESFRNNQYQNDSTNDMTRAISDSQFLERMQKLYKEGIRVLEKEVPDEETASISSDFDIESNINEENEENIIQDSLDQLSSHRQGHRNTNDTITGNKRTKNKNKNKNKRKRKHKNKSKNIHQQNVDNNLSHFIRETIYTTTKEYMPQPCQPTTNDIRGDTLDTKPNDHFRFLFQNANSFCPPILDKWKAIVSKIIELKCDIVGFCETRINWRLKSVRKEYKRILNSKSHEFGKLINPTISISAVGLPYDQVKLPGGTALVTHGKWTSQIKHQIKDIFQMGRWSGNVYRLSGEKQLYIISGYRPCNTTIGTSTSLSTAHQHIAMLAARNITNSNPRKQFVLDFCNQFRDICNNNNNYILFALDANSVIIEDTKGMGN